MTRILTAAVACAATLVALSAAPAAHADPVVRVGVNAPKVILRGPAPVVAPRIVVQTGQPVVLRPARPAGNVRWIPGHYQRTQRGAQVWVDGHWQRTPGTTRTVRIVR